MSVHVWFYFCAYCLMLVSHPKKVLIAPGYSGSAGGDPYHGLFLVLFRL